MCPECNQIQFFNEEEEYSTICPECNTNSTMEYICTELVDSVKEKQKEQELDMLFANPPTEVHCPYCNSINVSKISTASKVVNTAVFGIFGTKRHKQWYCKHCNSDF